MEATLNIAQQAAERLTGALNDIEWQPRRSNIESARNELQLAADEIARLTAERDRLREAIDRYRYAYRWWQSDAYDAGGEMRARFNWAAGEDLTQNLTDNEIAMIGQQFLKTTGRRTFEQSGDKT